MIEKRGKTPKSYAERIMGSTGSKELICTACKTKISIQDPNQINDCVCPVCKTNKHLNPFIEETKEKTHAEGQDRST